MAQLQFMFGNPSYKKSKTKRRSSVRKRRVTKKKNPARFTWKGGKSNEFLTTAERNKIKSVKESLGKEIVKRQKELASFKGSKSSSVFKRAKQALESARSENRKLRSMVNKSITDLKKASKAKNAAKAKGLKVKLQTVSMEGTPVKSIKSKLKKIDDSLKSLSKGGSVARKKTKKKKASKKKATRRKVSKKKVTKKKATSKKRKATKKRSKKKSTRKKVSKKKSVSKKASSKKRKTTKRKATKKKATRRRKSRKKSKSSKPNFFKTTTKRLGRRPKRATSYSKAMKRVRSASKRGAIAKGKSRSVSYKRNAFLGGINMKLKNLLKHDVMEAGGLFVGGFGHGAVNDAFSRYAPGLADMIGKWGGRFSGSLLPLLVGIGAGAANKKIKNQYLESFAKGLIGSSVVGIGATAYEVVRPGSTMSGKFAHDYPGLEGEYSQLGYDDSDYVVGGEYSQMGATASMSFDSIESETESGEDFGMEFESFDGDYSQLG